VKIGYWAVLIVEQVLRKPQKFKAIHRNWDVIHITRRCVPPAFLAVVKVVPTLLPGLVSTGVAHGSVPSSMQRFYGSADQEPTPDRTTQEHLAWFLTYLDRRERLYRSNRRWGDSLFPVAAILVRWECSEATTSPGPSP